MPFIMLTIIKTPLKILPLLLLSTIVLAQDISYPSTKATSANNSGPIPVYTVDRNIPQNTSFDAPQTAETLEANLTSRITSLEETIRQLTGQVEQQSFEIKRLKNQVGEQVAATPKKVAEPAGIAAYSGTSEIQRTIKEANQSPAAPIATTADGLYNQGYNLVKDGKYKDAATVFESFLKKYPKHNLTDNARYWLAETHYVREDYGLAAEDFLKVYENNPKGNKAADSLLKLSLSLGSMGSTEEACVTLDKLNEEYPDAARSINDRAAKEKVNLNCG